ncbi:uncharacterized protein METZ01_LOCUS170336 [marine metagenome]|uniref:Uncharacterized protein n=1 Tax=marine metagenome TaxID=408172 RepID=A0A382BVG4_9ZZZZ
MQVERRLGGPPDAEVAQSVEHMTENHGVGSSILPLGTILLNKNARGGI